MFLERKSCPPIPLSNNFCHLFFNNSLNYGFWNLQGILVNILLLKVLLHLSSSLLYYFGLLMCFLNMNILLPFW